MQDDTSLTTLCQVYACHMGSLKDTRHAMFVPEDVVYWRGFGLVYLSILALTTPAAVILSAAEGSLREADARQRM